MTEVNFGPDMTLDDRVKFACAGHSCGEVGEVGCRLIFNCILQTTIDKDTALGSFDALTRRMRKILEENYGDMFKALQPISGSH